MLTCFVRLPGRNLFPDCIRFFTNLNPLETLAANRGGDGWHGDLIKAEVPIRLLMTIELGTNEHDCNWSRHSNYH